MIKWRQHLSFLPSLASLLGVTSYTQEALSCSRTCSRVQEWVWSELLEKRHRAGVPKNKSELMSAVAALEQRELCEIRFRISRFLDWSLWCPVCLAFRRSGMGPFHAIGFGCAPSSTEVDPGFVFSCFLLSSNLNRGGRGRKGVRAAALSTCQQHCAWCKHAELPVKWHLLLWSLWWCGLFGFLLLWLPDLSGNILNFNTDLFLNHCSCSYASLPYPDERPIYFLKH